MASEFYRDDSRPAPLSLPINRAVEIRSQFPSRRAFGKAALYIGMKALIAFSVTSGLYAQDNPRAQVQVQADSPKAMIQLFGSTLDARRRNALLQRLGAAANSAPARFAAVSPSDDELRQLARIAVANSPLAPSAHAVLNRLTSQSRRIAPLINEARSQQAAITQAAATAVNFGLDQKTDSLRLKFLDDHANSPGVFRDALNLWISPLTWPPPKTDSEGKEIRIEVSVKAVQEMEPTKLLDVAAAFPGTDLASRALEGFHQQFSRTDYYYATLWRDPVIVVNRGVLRAVTAAILDDGHFITGTYAGFFILPAPELRRDYLQVLLAEHTRQWKADSDSQRLAYVDRLLGAMAREAGYDDAFSQILADPTVDGDTKQAARYFHAKVGFGQLRNRPLPTYRDTVTDIDLVDALDGSGERPGPNSSSKGETTFAPETDGTWLR